MLPAGSVPADDAHVLGVGEGVGGGQGGRGRLEAHQGGGGRARGLHGGDGGQQSPGLGLDVQRTLRPAESGRVEKVLVQDGHPTFNWEVKSLKLNVHL